jgi:hypothetical protein
MIKSIIVILFIFNIINIDAQSLENQISEIYEHQLGESYLKGYIEPLQDVIEIQNNAGLFFQTDSKSFPHISIGLTTAKIYLPASFRSFENSGDEQYPTLYGHDPSALVNGIMDQVAYLPVLDLSLGFFANLELLGRYARYKDKSLGDIEIKGAGLGYNINDFFKTKYLQIDIMFKGVYQKVDVGPLITAGIVNMGSTLSVTPSLTNFFIFAGGQYSVNEMILDLERFEHNKKLNFSKAPAFKTYAGLGLKLKHLMLQSSIYLQEEVIVDAGLKLSF